MSSVENFNRNLKLLVADLVRRVPKDAQIARLQRRVAAAIDLSPLSAIEAAGPYLYSYRAVIYSDDGPLAFFLDSPFDAELRAAAAGKPDAPSAAHILPIVKAVVRGLTPAQQLGYCATVVELLDDYIEFLALAIPKK